MNNAPTPAAPALTVISSIETMPAGAPTHHPPLVPTPGSRTVNVTFVLLKPGARQVSLCGEFNSWSPAATPLQREGKDRWAVTLALPPGRHQYKYVVDQQWLPDLNACEFVLNDFGSLDSVIEI